MRVELRQVGKRYQGQPALVNVDLALGPGECLLVCGPNGAGKSTLLRLLATLTPPTWGTIVFDGVPYEEWGPSLRRRIAALFHESLLYDELTAEENLNWIARAYALPRPAERVGAALEQVGLRAFRHELVGRFSRGMKQRLSLARCLLIGGDLILLDEPYEGLDSRGAQRLQAHLETFKAEGRTVVVVAHNWERAWSLADRLLLLQGGRVAWSGTKEEITPAAWQRMLESRGAREGRP